MTVRFYAESGAIVDEREMAVLPRAGEAVQLDGRRYYAGAVCHVLDGGEHAAEVTVLDLEQARRFLGAQTTQEDTNG